MRMKWLFAVLLLGCSAGAQAMGLDIALSKETAQFEFNFDSSAVGFGGAQFDAGLFFNSDDDYMGSFGLKAVGKPAGNIPLSFGVGARAYAAFIDTPDRRVDAIGIGGEIRYHIPANMPMSIGLEAYYAPDITTFSDGKRWTDAKIDYTLEVTPGTAFFVGARLLETRFEQSGEGTYKLDDNAHIGIRLLF